MALTHRYTLVCEDIRQENTGKWIVIGLYTHNIACPQLPFRLPSLSFLFLLRWRRGLRGPTSIPD